LTAKDLTAVRIGRNIIGIDQTTMKQSGIGGDDKVGVFTALECIRRFDTIKAAFFRDEETGCECSFEADIVFFEDCNFVLQCDRQGYKDFIVEAGGIELSDSKFQSAVSPLLDRFDYRTENGLMTNVIALKIGGVGCAVA
jgi:tripeptide aminopeptidase